MCGKRARTFNYIYRLNKVIFGLGGLELLVHGGLRDGLVQGCRCADLAHWDLGAQLERRRKNGRQRYTNIVIFKDVKLKKRLLISQFKNLILIDAFNRYKLIIFLLKFFFILCHHFLRNNI